MKSIVVDFDGVIHGYSKGWRNGEIYDPPIPGTKEALQKLMDEGYEIVIFTTRADDREIDGVIQKGQYDEVVSYLQKHQIPFSRVHRGVGKPLGKLYIDDNALRFEGDWDRAYEKAMDILNDNEPKIDKGIAYNNEILRILPLWEKELNGIDDQYQKEQVAICLENQRLMNKAVGLNEEISNTLIKIVNQVYRNFLGFKFISVQSILGPVGVIYCKNQKEEIVAKTRRLKTTFGNDVDLIAKSIKEEIEREIFTDLRNNAATVISMEVKAGYDVVVDQLFVANSIIRRKVFLKGIPKCDWIVISPDIAKVLKIPVKEDIDVTNFLGYTVIIDSLSPLDEILMGCYYPPYDSGYFHAPYVPLTINEGRFLMRYGKKLSKFGANYYARIKFLKGDR